MEFSEERQVFILNELDRDATGFPAEIPLEEAAVRALFLVEERIPYLRQQIVDGQPGDTNSQLDQRVLCHLYRQHFLAWDAKAQMTRRLHEAPAGIAEQAETFLKKLSEE